VGVAFERRSRILVELILSSAILSILNFPESSPMTSIMKTSNCCNPFCCRKEAILWAPAFVSSEITRAEISGSWAVGPYTSLMGTNSNSKFRAIRVRNFLTFSIRWEMGSNISANFLFFSRASSEISLASQ
jgi:hypothetical protein